MERTLYNGTPSPECGSPFLFKTRISGSRRFIAPLPDIQPIGIVVSILTAQKTENMRKAHILIIEDDDDIRELLQCNLEREGYRISGVATGEEGLDRARTDLPDIVLLDLMLPGIDGLDVCRTLKNENRTRQIPIVMLTAKTEEADIVAGLEIGADDYVTKPFSPRVLTARVKAILRRQARVNTSDSDVLRVHDIVIHPRRHEVIAGGKRVKSTPTEFRILHLLARRPGWVYTRHQVLDEIKDGDTVVTDRSVDVQIVNLRKKLGKHGRYIETVRGVGYRFMD